MGRLFRCVQTREVERGGPKSRRSRRAVDLGGSWSRQPRIGSSGRGRRIRPAIPRELPGGVRQCGEMMGRERVSHDRSTSSVSVSMPSMPESAAREYSGKACICQYRVPCKLPLREKEIQLRPACDPNAKCAEGEQLKVIRRSAGNIVPVSPCCLTARRFGS